MSLKDALAKAGFSSSKTQNDRARVAPKQKKKSEKHQEHRNFCEICESIQPDVERYKHRLPQIDGEWICVNCADKAELLDQYRVTNQSEFARAKKFMRYFGATKDFSKVSANDRVPRPNQNGNAKPSNHRKKHNPNQKKNFNR